MSINVANTAPGMVVVTAGIAIAQRLVQGEWSWTWMAYFWGGILAFSLIGSSLAGLFALIGYLTGGKERERERRLVQYEGSLVHLVKPGKNPPGVGRLVMVPELNLIQVDPLPAEIQQLVANAVERLKRDVAPGAWAQQLPDLLLPVREQGFDFYQPVKVWHWHDPGPSAPPPPTSTDRPA